MRLDLGFPGRPRILLKEPLKQCKSLPRLATVSTSLCQIQEHGRIGRHGIRECPGVCGSVETQIVDGLVAILDLAVSDFLAEPLDGTILRFLGVRRTVPLRQHEYHRQHRSEPGNTPRQ